MGFDHIVGLKQDGTVLAVGMSLLGQLEVDSWADIIQVAAGGAHTVWLKSDGTVMTAGNDHRAMCKLNDWNLFCDTKPEIELSLNLIDFGEVKWKQTASILFTISKAGNEPLVVSHIFLDKRVAVFKITSALALPLKLAPGQSIDVEVSFMPHAVKSYQGLLVIKSNDKDEALIEVPINGIGVSADSHGCGLSNFPDTE